MYLYGDKSNSKYYFCIVMFYNLYIMKHLLLIISLLCFNVTYLHSENESISESQSKNEVFLNEKNDISHPRLPSKYRVSCVYTSEYINLYLPENCMSATVSIKTNGEVIETSIITVDNGYIPISLSDGEYEITCFTDNGKTYSGTITI